MRLSSVVTLGCALVLSIFTTAASLPSASAKSRGLSYESSVSLSQNVSSSRDALALAKRMAMQTSIQLGPGNVAILTNYEGDPWQTNVDIHNHKYITHILELCEESYNRRGYLVRDIHSVYGPLQLSRRRQIFYVSIFRSGVYYNDIHNTLLWSISADWRVLESVGTPNVWAQWKPSHPPRSFAFATPWLRTNTYVLQGWTSRRQPLSDILIAAVVTNHSTPSEAVAGIVDRLGRQGLS